MTVYVLLSVYNEFKFIIQGGLGMSMMNNKEQKNTAIASCATLLSAYTWENVVTSTSNLGVYKIAKRIVAAKNISDVADVCVFYGKKGLGKTQYWNRFLGKAASVISPKF